MVYTEREFDKNVPYPFKNEALPPKKEDKKSKGGLKTWLSLIRN